MIQQRSIFSYLLFLLLIISCSSPTESSIEHAKSFVLTTTLGADTIGIERVEVADLTWKAEVLLRSPETNLTTYELRLNSAYEVEYFHAVSYDLTQPNLYDKVLREQKFHLKGDSLEVEVLSGRAQNRMGAKISREIIPFLEFVHWPFEVILNKMKALGKRTLRQPMLSGNRTIPFQFHFIGKDSAEVIHPRRGKMEVALLDGQSIQVLDAKATTRKLRVNRSSKVDLAGSAKQFLKLDQEGKGIGALSGRGKLAIFTNGANIDFDYGQPAKRGRALFGSLVPWGRVWRTGANLATHMKIDKTIVFGNGLKVPPGAYTIFTQPEPDGGTLFINKKTGINGRAYDPSENLGEVKMGIQSQPNSTELFTINVSDVDQPQLELIWGQTKFTVPFRVE